MIIRKLYLILVYLLYPFNRIKSYNFYCKSIKSMFHKTEKIWLDDNLLIFNHRKGVLNKMKYINDIIWYYRNTVWIKEHYIPTHKLYN